MEATGNMEWPLIKKLLFRFFFVYFLLYIFFNPNGIVPYIDDLAAVYLKPFQTFGIWVGNQVLHMKDTVSVHLSGSGDTAYDYVTLLLTAVYAFVSMIIWSAIDRKPKNYNKLSYWLTVMLRYYIAITMLNYGFYKVIKLQFPSPGLGRLIEPYGNSSPMGLAWTFMGQSVAYNWFTGLAELSCGALLFFRKTSALGAVVTLVVAANIMAINYCFDVPVKLLSTSLVAMSLLLILKDTSRFSNFFLFNKTAAPSNIEPHRFKKGWKNITLNMVKYVLIAYSVIFNVYGAIKAEKEFGAKAPKSPLYGLYDAKKFIVNKDTLKPLTTDLTRWSKLALDGQNYALVKYMNDSTERLSVKVDTIKRTVIFFHLTDTVNRYNFNYTKPDKDSLYFVGKFKKDSIKIKFHRNDATKFLLVRRSFHWISEYPYNR